MDQKFVDIAKTELGEDASKREQSLAQFRGWLAKHPFLNGVRQDDVHLLLFLRVRKFAMDATFESFEKFYLSRRMFPHFRDLPLDKMAMIDMIFNSGLYCPLMNRDEHGRKIVLIHGARLDTNIFTPDDGLKFFIYATLILLEEEETQIAGMTLIFDNDAVTRKHFVSPTSLRDFLILNKMCGLVRQKGYFGINLPGYAKVLLEIVIAMVSEKFKSRIYLLKDFDGLKKHIDASLLPKEYGGTVPEAEMLNKFAKLREKKKDLIKKIISFDVDVSKISPEKLKLNDNRESIGSFRKLEID